MSTLDDIAQERQRLAERLSKLDSERERLVADLAELDAAERVLARFAQAPRRRRGRPRRDLPEAQKSTEPGGRRPRGATTDDDAAMSLGDATMRAVQANEGGVSSDMVRDYLAREFGMQVRPNHLGMALQRHRRAGRLERRDELWFPAATEQ